MKTNLLVGLLLSVVSTMADAQTYTFKSEVRAFGPIGIIDRLKSNFSPPTQPATLEGEFEKNGQLIPQLAMSLKLKEASGKDCNDKDYVWKNYTWLPKFDPNQLPYRTMGTVNVNSISHEATIEIFATTSFQVGEDVSDTALMGLAEPLESFRTKISIICPKLPVNSEETVECILGADSSLEHRLPLTYDVRNVFLQKLNDDPTISRETRPGFFLPLVHVKLKSTP